MKRNFVSALYVINIVWQSLITFVSPPALLGLIAWLLVSRAGAPTWVYAPFIIVGVLVGFVSMIRFVIRSSEGFERLEKSQEENDREKRK